ncbi:thiaminase II [Halogeometricum borinquense]|uniref:Thiaminase4-amino-5-aminomethyl-2-methylpyrimidine deaminase n=2 Tax=Halogeometricum borinquense TaxID=60847 RepID=E4NU73_HALBP|nr:thiaminase II [Halogeometricum borinquense]ADQ68593.1 thiaminase;4-amino-5-aminomethyl-2-methylpyrimidine deaminase [Halogeometricum borinquense DSM 11551]ELY25536.1 thiaminase;4-amino-5-aminomethyl-2-methylpyrimidine deaminase [Halogeometricum borinquense DSM 11551]QIB75592.1 thiaminase II [Halogeometricum borinquense]RYJ08577.1 thiaminase II [Halogeometricum borinquense]
MAFTDDLSAVADPVWDAIVAHPMVEQLGAGTLSTEPFEYWVRQDYVYLVDYSRVFAYGAATAPDLDKMGTFAELLDSTINTEMDLHRAYAAEFGISEAELEATEASPTTRAYTDFLVRVAATGTFGDLVAVLLPCMWGFNETAKRLESEGMPDDDRYAEWIQTYAGEEFTELTTWCKELMNDVAVGRSDAERERFRNLFETSARYEYRFWDAAWRQEEWSI